jgi:hypothetical protein
MADFARAIVQRGTAIKCPRRTLRKPESVFK